MAISPAWFNNVVYLQNKAAASGLSTADVKSAFESAGFSGADGAFLHFIQYGQWEDVAPVAGFDAEYYYKSKVAYDNGISLSSVTDAQVSDMKAVFNQHGLNAWSHYQLYGAEEGIDASADFDTSAYMESKLAHVQKSKPGYTMDQLCDDFAAAGLTPVAHYYAYGKAEGLQAEGVSDSVSINPDPGPAPKPMNVVSATFISEDVTFINGIEDTFVTQFGSGQSTVRSFDFADISLNYGIIYAGDWSILPFSELPYLAAGSTILFANTSGETLSGDALAEKVGHSGWSPPEPWVTTGTEGSKVFFTSKSIGDFPDLYGKYSYSSSAWYMPSYLTLFSESVIEGISGNETDEGFNKSYSSLWYNSVGMLIDTINGFNSSEDRIDLPTTIQSLINGGTVSSRFDLMHEASKTLGANQAGLFKCEGEYYLLVNDENPFFDMNVDVSIKLAGLSDVDAANMTADIFI
jgi:hypothetical protein